MEKSVEGKTINVPIVSALRRVHDGEYQASTIMYQPKAFSSSPKHEGDEMRSIGRTSVPLPCPVIKLQYHVAMSAALETAFHPSIRPCVRTVSTSTTSAPVSPSPPRPLFTSPTPSLHYVVGFGFIYQLPSASIQLPLTSKNIPSSSPPSS